MNTKSKRNKKQKLIDEYGTFCYWCARCLREDEMTIDHLYPKSRGGSNTYENLRIACFPCNNRRGDSLYPPGWGTRNQSNVGKVGTTVSNV